MTANVGYVRMRLVEYTGLCEGALYSISGKADLRRVEDIQHSSERAPPNPRVATSKHDQSIRHSLYEELKRLTSTTVLLSYSLLPRDGPEGPRPTPASTMHMSVRRDGDSPAWST